MDGRSAPRPDPRTLVRRASRDLSGRRPAGGATTTRRAPDAWRPAWRAAASLVPRFVRFFAVIAFVCGVASFAGSSTFDIQTIGVVGNEAVAADDVVAASGLRPEMSVFAVNAVRVRDRLRRDARIADAAVEVVFPGGVRITIKERPAAAALRVPGGYVLVTAEGVALAPASAAQALPVLTVDLLDPTAVQAGTALPSAGARLGAQLAASLPTALQSEVTALRVDREGEVILYTRDGIAVKAGGADGARDRIARAGDVLAAVRARGMHVEYVDLRFPESIVVKPVPANPATPPLMPQPGTLPVGQRPNGAHVP
jgi:cell division protein FtsQ